MASLKLSSPWAIFHREVEAFFKGDMDVNVLLDEDEMTLRIFVEDPVKVEALQKIIPPTKTFGNVELNVEVIPANKEETESSTKLYKCGDNRYFTNVYEAAFYGNEALSYIRTVNYGPVQNYIYVVFKKEVVQFFTDNIGDINGLCSTLYENLARDIFVTSDMVFFNTEAQATRVRRLEGAPQTPYYG